jgi:uncharacterized protein (AIM24 family)
VFGELMPHPRDAVIAETAHHDALSQLCRKESLPVNLWTGEHKKPAFLATNYSGTLPVLELADGTLIAECGIRP